MTAKMARGALALVASIAACLFVATPARAAQADVVVTSVGALSQDQLQVNGSVTCTEPTGAAHVTVMATQVVPFSFGAAELDVPCAAGPVAWEVTVYSGFGWQIWHSTSVNAHMTDDHAGTASFSGTFLS